MTGTKTYRQPHPGETRDCLDPWKMTFIKADGSVSLCCWSAPVGNIAEAPVDQILHNAASREMRRGLLTGEMPVDCVKCPARMLMPVAEFRGKVERFLADDGRTERTALRARLHATQENVVALRHHASNVEQHAHEIEQHVRNLEEEREHLRRHVGQLTERVDAVAEGRMPLTRVLGSWTRGRLRRSALGRWWMSRRGRATA